VGLFTDYTWRCSLPAISAGTGGATELLREQVVHSTPPFFCNLQLKVTPLVETGSILPSITAETVVKTPLMSAK